eukprot:scaffold53_cov362-Prasinococcus_capsulatus_cf.AAC.13
MEPPPGPGPRARPDAKFDGLGAPRPGPISGLGPRRGGDRNRRLDPCAGYAERLPLPPGGRAQQGPPAASPRALESKCQPVARPLRPRTGATPAAEGPPSAAQP